MDTVADSVVVKLKAFDVKFASELYALIDESRADLKNLVWSQTATLETTRSYLASKSAPYSGAFVILADGEVAGCIEIRDKPEGWELGYWLGSRFRGRGIMQQAAVTMTDMFRPYLKKPIVAHIRLQNFKSKGILEHAGLREIHRDDEWIYLAKED